MKYCFECKLAVEVFSFDACLDNTSNSQHFYSGPFQFMGS